MDLIITIISEKHSPTLTVRMDNEESALFALPITSLEIRNRFRRVAVFFATR